MKLAGAYINDETYGRLAALAAANNRTLAGQCRHLFDRALKGELEVPDGPVAHAARAAAAHSVPGAGVKARAKQARGRGAALPGIPSLDTPQPELPSSGITAPAMEPLCRAAGRAAPRPQAVRQARAGRCGRQVAGSCESGCCSGQGSCCGRNDCTQGAASFHPNTNTMHTPTMNHEPSGAARHRTPRRTPR
jgi:hypothetical protein